MVTFSSTGQSPPANTVVATEELTLGGSTAHVQLFKLLNSTAGSTVPVSTAAPLPVYLQGSTVSVAPLSTASAIQVEPKSGATFTIAALSTASKVQAEITGGQSTAIVSTASAIRVEPVSGAEFTIAALSTASVVRIGNSSGQKVPVSIEGSTGNVGVLVNNSTATAIPVALTLASTLVSSGQPLPVDVFPYAGTSTYASTTLTSTSAATLLSSAASTRFNVTGLTVVNGGATAVNVRLFDGSTGGNVLFLAYCASAGGGVAREFLAPLRTSSGSALVVQADAGSTVTVSIDAFRSA